MKKNLLFLVLAFTLVFGSSVFAAGSVKIQNPGFEEVNANKIDFWIQHHYESGAGVASFSFDDKIFHSGKRSAVIQNNKVDDSRYKQTIKVESNTLYKLSCWIKTENIGKVGTAANLSIEGLLDTSNEVKGTTTKWTQAVIYGKTLENQTSLILTVGIGGYGHENTGKAWFDDVKVEKITTTPAGAKVINLAKVPDSEKPVNGANGSNSNYFYIIAIIAVVLIIVVVSFVVNKSSKKGKASDELNENEEFQNEEDETEEAQYDETGDEKNDGTDDKDVEKKDE